MNSKPDVLKQILQFLFNYFEDFKFAEKNEREIAVKTVACLLSIFLGFFIYFILGFIIGVPHLVAILLGRISGSGIYLLSIFSVLGLLLGVLAKFRIGIVLNVIPCCVLILGVILKIFRQMVLVASSTLGYISFVYKSIFDFVIGFF